MGRPSCCCRCDVRRLLEGGGRAKRRSKDNGKYAKRNLKHTFSISKQLLYQDNRRVNSRYVHTKTNNTNINLLLIWHVLFLKAMERRREKGGIGRAFIYWERKLAGNFSLQTGAWVFGPSGSEILTTILYLKSTSTGLIAVLRIGDSSGI